MATPEPKALTYRVEGIPKGTTPDQLKKNFFYTEDQHDLIVMSLYPSVESVEGEEEKDLTATVLFRPRIARPSGPRVQDRNIEVDKEFTGFTPLYVPPAGKGAIAADIIAVTGLAGHAYGSWAHSDDRMWLRDYLKHFASDARILTYGYVSELQNGPFSILHDYTARFVNDLVTMREDAQCQQRPIIFIGHSLGCLIIKKALIDTGSIGVNASRLPVRAILFLAAPHKGIHVKALQTLVKGRPSERMIAELEEGSSTLLELNDRFADMAHGIEIHTFYETLDTRTVKQNEDGSWARNGPAVTMVSRDSARLFFPGENRLGVHADHSQIAKIKLGQSGFFPQVRSAIVKALIPTALIVAKDYPGPNRELRGDRSSQRASHSGRPPSGRTSSGSKSPSRTTQEPVPQPPNTFAERSSSSGTCEEDPLPGPGKTSEAKGDIDRKASQPEPTEKEDNSSSTQDYEDELDQPPTKTKRCESTSLRSHTSSEATLNFDEATKPVRCDDTATIASAEDREKTISHVSHAAKCNTCHKPIPNRDPHYRCRECFESTDEDVWWCCSSCFRKDSECPEHTSTMDRFTIIECFGFRHDVPFVDKEVSNCDTSIVKAIKQNDVKALQRAIRNRRLLTAFDGTGSTPLHLAARLGRLECADVLLRVGAPKDGRDLYNDTPLMLAVAYNHLALVRLFLKHYVDINASNADQTALSCAVKNGQSDMVSIMLENDAKIEHLDGPALLVEAASNGDEVTLTLLLDAGADVDQKETESGDCALFQAVVHGHEQIVRLLLSRHADVDAVNEKSQTPISETCNEGRTSLTRMLLVAGADVNIAGPKCNTPLHNASRKGHLEDVDLLLERGANIEAKTVGGLTPLLVAAIEGKSQICQRLLDAQAEIEAKRLSNERTALLLAFRNNHFEIVHMLLNHGADADSQDHEGFACLHWAAERGNLEICEALVNHGADLNLETKPTSELNSGMTPLHLATKYGHSSVVQFLLSEGAEVDATDCEDYTSLHWAAERGDSEICECLLTYRASTDLETLYSKTPLGRAIERGHSAVVELLLDYGGADPDQTCDGLLPLYKAARLGDMDSLKSLVEYDASLDMENGGLNALSGAAFGGHVEAIKFLLEKGASGAPPSGYGGKWKHQAFSNNVGAATQSLILRLLRDAKHK